MRKLLFILSVMLASGGVDAQWATNGPTGSNGTVYSIAVSGNNIFAGTDGGGVFLSTNNGGSWTAVNNGLTYTTVMALTVNGSDIFAGTNGSMYVSGNNGTSWTAVNNGLTNTSEVFYALASNGTDVFVGIEGDGVYVTSDNGTTWSAANAGLNTIFPTSITAVGSNVYVASAYDSVYISANNGATWATANCTGLPAVELNAIMVTGYGIYVATEGDGVYVSTNNGATFTAANTGLPHNYIPYAFAQSGSTIFVGGEQGTLYESTNNGASWISIGSGLPTDNYVSSMALNGPVIFAGTYGMNVWQETLTGLGCNLTEPVLTAGATTFCPGDSTQICAPAGFKSYLWNTGGTGNCIYAKQAQKYYVTVTDTNSCTANSDTVTVTLYTAPSVTITAGSTSFCPGDSTQICAPGTFSSYKWNTGATTDCIYAKQAEGYDVTVTNSNTCSAVSNTITTTLYASPSVTISATTNPFCSGDSTQICTAGTFSTYRWNTGATTDCIYASQANSYDVTVTNSNSCSAISNTITTSISQPPSVTISTNATGFCPGDSTQLCTTGTFSTYRWNTGATVSCIYAKQAEGYDVTVTNSSNCSAVSNTITTSLYTAPSATITANATSFCAGDSTQLCTTGSFSSYKWNTGATGSCIYASVAADYDVTVTNANSCSAESNVLVVTTKQIPAPVISASASAFCTGDSASLCAPTGYASYQWNVPGAGNCIYARQQGTYYVNVTDTNGCTAESNGVFITVHPIPVDTISTTVTIFCANDSIQLCAPAGYTIYQWNPGVTGTGNCVTIQQAGDYYVQVTDSNGCSAQSGQLSISVYPVPQVSVTQHGDTLESFGQVSYLWLLDGQPLPGDTSDILIVSQPGSYAVQVTDTSGCTTISQPVLVSGISALAADDGLINVFPNPSSVGSWQLTVDQSLVGSALAVFDEQGRLVFKSEILNPKSEITAGALAAGVYYLRISNAAGSLVRKLVKL